MPKLKTGVKAVVGFRLIYCVNFPVAPPSGQNVNDIIPAIAASCDGMRPQC